MSLVHRPSPSRIEQKPRPTRDEPIQRLGGDHFVGGLAVDEGPVGGGVAEQREQVLGAPAIALGLEEGGGEGEAEPDGLELGGVVDGEAEAVSGDAGELAGRGGEGGGVEVEAGVGLGVEGLEEGGGWGGGGARGGPSGPRAWSGGSRGGG